MHHWRTARVKMVQCPERFLLAASRCEAGLNSLPINQGGPAQKSQRAGLGRNV